jgi:prevent-host-death family protein
MDAMNVDMPEAKRRLAELIRSARSGEEVVIFNLGEPVARLLPIDAGGQLRGEGGRLLDWLASNASVAHVQRSHDEIEAGIAEERNAWD